MAEKGKINISTVTWRIIKNPDRSFVLYRIDEEHAASIKQIRFSAEKMVLSVILPTKNAERNGYFRQLLKQIHKQTFKDFELIIVRGDRRQGRAINIGASIARGRYLMTLDDDTSLPDKETFEKLVKVIKDNPDIGIAGGNNVIPESAAPFVKRVMKEIPRRSWAPVFRITDSDFAEHPCMIMRREEFIAVGGENELIPRGLDPYLREQFRKSGKRVVIVPNVVYHHLPPDRLAGLLRRFYRNGVQASYTNRKYPQWVIETPVDHGAFKTRVPLSVRTLRFPIRLLQAVINGRFIWFLSECAYALGFVIDVVINKSQMLSDRKRNRV